MSRNRFVISNQTVRIPLSEEEWIEVKKELNAGEERKASSLALVPTKVDGKIIDRVDWAVYELYRTHLWLVDWHIHDENGKVPSLSLDSLKALDIDTFNEINDLIFKHILEQEKSKKAAKNPSGSKDAPIS